MGSVTLEIAKQDPKFYSGRRVNQGEAAAGAEPMATILRSCVCIGLYCPARRVGAISHVTGFSDDRGHGAKGAVDEMARQLRRLGAEIEDCECFLVGGSDAARHVYEEALAELARRAIAYKEMDMLGRFHRKIVFDPATGKLILYKRSEAEMARNARRTYSADTSFECFHDSRRRLITGASLFFRNEALIDHLRREILPTLTARSSRLHTWCAGCSNGMEVYSIAMVVHDWLVTRGHDSVDFKILGSDISDEALATASRGEYAVSENAVRKHADLFNKYTNRLDSARVRMAPDLRRLAAFRKRDIRQGSRKHKFELIVCDHVLQYFDPAVQEEFLVALVKALDPNGYLFCSSPSPNIPERLREWGFRVLARSFYRHKDAS